MPAAAIEKAGHLTCYFLFLPKSVERRVFIGQDLWYPAGKIQMRTDRRFYRNPYKTYTKRPQRRIIKLPASPIEILSPLHIAFIFPNLRDVVYFCNSQKL
jgi:hypothetical protein